MEKKLKEVGNGRFYKILKKPEEVGRKNLTLEGFIPAETKETGKTMKEYLKEKDHTLLFLFPSSFLLAREEETGKPTALQKTPTPTQFVKLRDYGVGISGVEMVVSVGEMTEAAVGAIEWSYQRMVGKAVDKEWECAEVEKEVQSERKENSRLRAIIAMYEQAFCQLHQQKIEDGYFSEELSMEVYKKLKLNVESAAFLEKPKLSSANASNGMSSESISVTAEGGMLLRPDVDDLDGWLWLSETDLVPSGDHKEVKDCVGADGYVLINQEDIVDSIASFMACYISSIPQAKNLSTKELQDAIAKAFKKVEKKGKIHQLWETGKFLYTAGSWGATALSIYSHPIVVRAASMAMWTSFWLIVKVVT